MKILAFMGSPRTKGKCNQLTRKALEGAAARGAEVKNYELIKCNIKYCMGCGSCYMHNPDLTIGKCPMKDDMAAILEDYVSADAYIFSSPCYDVFCTALMKTFLERKIALTYRDPSEAAKIPAARPGVGAEFRKKAAFIVTANCDDSLEEVMGEPCYEAFEAHLMIEQVETIEKMYVGGVENITDEEFQNRLQKAYDMGTRLAEAVTAAGVGA